MKRTGFVMSMMVPAALVLAVASPSELHAAELPVLNKGNGFGTITRMAKCTAGVENGLLTIKDISFDQEICFKVNPFFAAEVGAIDIRYRASGLSKRTGGQIYYAPGSDGYVGGRCWKIPPLEADGKWHVLHLTEKNLPNPEEWRSCGILDRFRLDITDSPGGRIEIAEIAFLRKGSDAQAAEGGKAENLDPAFVSALDADVWPAALPETFGPAPAETVRATHVRCRGLSASRQNVKAGDTILLSLHLEGDVPDFPVKLAVSLWSGESLRWTEDVWLGRDAFHRVGGKVWCMEFPYRLPVCLDSGALTVRADSPSIHYVSGELPSANICFVRATHAPGCEKPVVAEVRKIAGSPQFFVNGSPFYALCGLVWRPLLHSRAPLNLVTVKGGETWWTNSGDLDAAGFDLAAERNLRLYPDAYFIWDLDVYPPPGWAAAHPDELARDEKGRGGNEGQVNYSFASKKAFDDMGQMIEKAIRYLEQSPYANRIIGYRINSGHTTEWLGWSAMNGSAFDFSGVAANGFADYLAKFHPEVSERSVPSIEERKDMDAPQSVVWNISKHARVVAYNDYYSRLVSDGMLRMCRKAKDVLGGKKLVGTYFGYSMTLMEFGQNHMRGHFCTKRALDNAVGAVDFLVSPQGYCFGHRYLGDPIVDMKPFASLHDHGIVSMIEDDTRTHNMRPVNSGTQTCTEEQTVGVMRRNMGFSLCRGQPFYTYALCEGSEFNFPRFAADATELRKAGAHALAVGTRRNAEIAVAVSEEAIKAMPDVWDAPNETFGCGEQYYRIDGSVDRRTKVSGPPFVRDVFGKFYERLSRIGAPVDYRLAEDMADNPGNYRLYIFQGCLRYDPAIAKAAALLRKRNCTILWVYAPGFVAADGNSTASMKALTGIDFAIAARQDAAITLPDGTATGRTGHDVLPLFKVASRGETLGRYANGEAAFVAVRTGSAESVFFGSYRVELPVLQMLAKRAGVHIYTDSTDPVEANDRFFTLHARFAGKKTVRLPRRTAVYDVFNRRLVTVDAKSFSFEAPLHSSWLFYCADDAAAMMP